MDKVFAWQCMLSAVLRSNVLKDGTLDGGTRVSMGETTMTQGNSKFWDELLQLEVKNSGNDVSISFPFARDVKLQNELFMTFVANEVKSITSKAQFGKNPMVQSLGVLKLFFDFLDRWLYANLLGVVRLRVCTQPMLEGEKAHEIIYIERARLLKGVRDRIESNKSQGGYVLFDFDHVPSKKDKGQVLTPDSSSLPANPKQKIQLAKKSNALPLFFDFPTEGVIRSTTQKRKKKELPTPYYQLFAEQLEKEGRGVDARSLRAFRTKTENQTLISSLDPKKGSIYEEWVKRIGDPTNSEIPSVPSLYREWILRRAGYVVKEDNRSKIEGLKTGSDPCGQGSVLPVVKQLADALYYLQNQVAPPIGMVEHTNNNFELSGRMFGPSPPWSLVTMLGHASLVRGQVIYGPILTADHEYINAAVLPYTLGHYFTTKTLVDQRRDFVKGYYSNVESVPSSGQLRTPEQIKPRLLGLETLFYIDALLFLATSYKQLIEEILSKAKPLSTTSVANEILSRQSPISQELEWKKSLDKGVGISDKELSDGAYSLGTSAPLFARMVEEAALRPFLALLPKKDKLPHEIRRDKNLLDDCARVSDEVLPQAMALLTKWKDHLFQAIDANKLPNKAIMTNDGVLRSSLLSVRNYFLEHYIIDNDTRTPQYRAGISDANLRRTLVNGIDNMWAEHLGDIYSDVDPTAMNKDFELWRLPLRPEELTERLKDELIPRQWFRRPTAEDYDNVNEMVPRLTLRQQILGGDKDWQHVIPPSKALSKNLDKLMEDTSKIIDDALTNNEQLQQFINDNPDVDMSDLSDEVWSESVAPLVAIKTEATTIPLQQPQQQEQEQPFNE